MSRGRNTGEMKLFLVEEYLRGEKSYAKLEKEYGIDGERIREWVNKYKLHGINALNEREGNRSYSKEFKIQCVEAVMRGEGSISEIATRYNLTHKSVLRDWIKRYNANMELKENDPKREIYMAARRKTTLEERKEIVEYCILHGKDYKNTAAHYEVSYGQVYDWVRKYLADGEKGLEDCRGHHKTDEEVDELERLRRENERLKRQLKESDMLVELLKKVKEFERM